jgi:hypothetical protein
MALVGLAAVWSGTLVIANPVLAHEPVGSYPVLNWLLYVYGVPAVLTGLVAYTLRRFLNMSPSCSPGPDAVAVPPRYPKRLTPSMARPRAPSLF